MPSRSSSEARCVFDGILLVMYNTLLVLALAGVEVAIIRYVIFRT